MYLDAARRVVLPACSNQIENRVSCPTARLRIFWFALFTVAPEWELKSFPSIKNRPTSVLPLPFAVISRIPVVCWFFCLFYTHRSLPQFAQRILITFPPPVHLKSAVKSLLAGLLSHFMTVLFLAGSEKYKICMVRIKTYPDPKIFPVLVELNIISGFSLSEITRWEQLPNAGCLSAWLKNFKGPNVEFSRLREASQLWSV